MEKLTSCPACQSTQLSPWMTCIDHTVSKEAFDIVICGNCDLEFTNPRPAANEIGYYYESQDYVSHTDQAAPGMVNRLYREVRKTTLKQKRNMIEDLHPIGSLLDIGCGTGAFAGNMQAAGWRVKAVEPDREAAAKASFIQQLEVYEESWLERTQETFDVVTMWHVLEHVHGLEQRFKQLRKLVKPGGLLIIAVPNPHSIDARHYGAQWAARDLPRHLYHFPPSMLRKRVVAEGFTVVDTKPMHFDPFYISMLSEKYKRGKDVVLLGLIKGFWFWFRSLWIRDAFSSQIYIFKRNLL
jgi:2-polyprenyl-3-methyl-5-hydroxy-6-metoxy-1,4-benzoquinol methylase/transcription elongation factor Elf1